VAASPGAAKSPQEEELREVNRGDEPARAHQPDLLMRLGLCCLFTTFPVKFRTTTATHAGKLPERERRGKLGELALHNAATLNQALVVCEGLGIRAFRIMCGVLPLYTHPQLCYRIEELPSADAIVSRLREAGEFARRHGIRLSFHPDQFTVLSTPRPETLASSIRELMYMGELSELLGADAINIHGGGVYGDKEGALGRLAASIRELPDPVRSRLTLENDDVSYTPLDLLPVCRETGVPLVYDVHHHRCLPDGLSVEEATAMALRTWNREPLFHISSPRDRGAGANRRPHADYIEPSDFPDFWRDLHITVDVEAKAKEAAVLALADAIGAGVEPRKPRLSPEEFVQEKGGA
jgi:UV DNA damage endonuclease